MKKIIDWYEEKSDKLRVIFVAISAVFLIAALVFDLSATNDTLVFAFSLVAIVLCGLPIIFGAIIGVIRDHDITADVLVSLALIGSLILKEWFAAGEVALIMQIGSMLEDFTSARAKKGITKLIKLTPKKANLIKDGTRSVVDADLIKEGDIIEILAGESVPVDSIVLEGDSSLDESAMTGESIPVEKHKGDTLMSGTINQSGALKAKALKCASDSSLQRIIRLADKADAEKAKIVRSANKWAAWLVVVSMSTALISGLVIGLINADFWLGFTRAVTVLVVFCPCAFVLATPTAISAGIGNASRHGMIIQSGEALERISEANVAVFDKTGTLTKGKPEVCEVKSCGSLSQEEILKIAASGEALSTHPLAKAILSANQQALYEVSDHQTIPGEGISFILNGDFYKVGKTKEKDARSTVGLYKNNHLEGIIYIQDAVKPEAMEMVSQLHEMGIQCILLSGDNEANAKAVANELQMDDFKAGVTPEGKLTYVKELESKGFKVCMFGDGVNDSLALRASYAGVAMGGIGSDAAIESSDAVIVKDNLDVIPYLFFISRKTKKRIYINLSISMCINIVAVVLAIIGILNTVWGALYHNCGSVAVVISAFCLLFTKRKNKAETQEKGSRSKVKETL